MLMHAVAQHKPTSRDVQAGLIVALLRCGFLCSSFAVIPALLQVLQLHISKMVYHAFKSSSPMQRSLA